jgi:hypothetical protein
VGPSPAPSPSASSDDGAHLDPPPPYGEGAFPDEKDFRLPDAHETQPAQGVDMLTYLTAPHAPHGAELPQLHKLPTEKEFSQRFAHQVVRYFVRKQSDCVPGLPLGAPAVDVVLAVRECLVASLAPPSSALAFADEDAHLAFRVKHLPAIARACLARSKTREDHKLGREDRDSVANVLQLVQEYAFRQVRRDARSGRGGGSGRASQQPPSPFSCASGAGGRRESAREQALLSCASGAGENAREQALLSYARSLRSRAREQALRSCARTPSRTNNLFSCARTPSPTLRAARAALPRCAELRALADGGAVHHGQGRGQRVLQRLRLRPGL